MKNAPDLIYYSLAGILLLTLVYIVIRAIAILRRPLQEPTRRRALGIILTACGAVVVLIAGVLLNEFARDRIITDLQYQMIHFAIFYGGMVMILAGLNSIALATGITTSSADARYRWSQSQIAVSVLFVITVIIASIYLFNPNTYTITQVGSRTIAAQQQIFYLPLFFTLLVVILAPAILVLSSRDLKIRRHLVWFSLFAAFFVVGMLRESTLIPSTGSQVIDNLLVFVPFALGGICLLASLYTIPKDASPVL